MKQLEFSIPAFANGSQIPKEYSARGKDISPEMHIENICEGAISMAITMDDASHPLFPNYNHWVIWDLPVMETVPAAIPKGEFLENLGGAVQGIAYGKHCYKGPKPPLRSVHTYVFKVYILDIKIDLPPKSGREELLEKMEDHILQTASYSGTFQNGKN